jgi:3-oxoacyl-[acyl-carrier-protein] synthase-3
MDSSGPFLSGPAFSVGTPRLLDELEIAGEIDSEDMNLFRERGLERYCDDDRPLSEACIATVLLTLEKTSLRPSQIDAIVFANSSSSWTSAEEKDLLGAFAAAGFDRKIILGLHMQACSALNCALRVASDMLRQSTGKNVLVVVFGRAKGPGERVGPATVFSDGAASCVVSSERGPFHILASEALTTPNLASLPFGDARLMTLAYKELCHMARSILAKTHIAPAQLRGVFGSNTNCGSLELIAEAAGVNQRTIYKEDLSKYGHVFACDNLIGLTNFCSTQKVLLGEYFLLLSWSPYVVGASLLCASGE